MYVELNMYNEMWVSIVLLLLFVIDFLLQNYFNGKFDW